MILLKFYRTEDIHVLLIFTSKVSIFFDLQIAEIQTHGEHLVVFIHIQSHVLAYHIPLLNNIFFTLFKQE